MGHDGFTTPAHQAGQKRRPPSTYQSNRGTSKRQPVPPGRTVLVLDRQEHKVNHSHHPGVPTPEHVSNTTTLARVWLNRQEAADYLGVTSTPWTDM